MKTPQELLAALMGEETAETAVVIYKEAGSYAGAYKEIQQAALACARADLAAGGEARRKTTFGNCGWTKPKSRDLDKDTWPQACQENPDLAAVEGAFLQAQQALKQAQAPYTRLKQPRFYIR
ncbi:MAG TPA: hypothetical protein EYP41_01190 [Anaerolineae bacterium]|nr:hypothetical protein [Anaerolineae bacterium]HIP70521.1 hypothetical protein [Anaerolineae bacterium]